MSDRLLYLQWEFRVLTLLLVTQPSNSATGGKRQPLYHINQIIYETWGIDIYILNLY